MKHIFFLTISFVLISFSLSAQTDAIDKFFNDYKTNGDFKIISINSKAFDLLNKATSDKDDSEFLDIVKDLKGLKILTTSKNAMLIYADANKRVIGAGYEELMKIRDNESNIRFVTKETNGNISELVMILGEKDNFTVLSFIGNIDLKKIAKLSKTLDVKGVEHLDKVNKKK